MKKRIISWGIVAAVVLAIGWHFWSTRPVTLGPGIKARVDPVQTKIEDPQVFYIDNAKVTPLAEFQIRAKVLSTQRYRWDKSAKLSPVDLALGWGNMSDEKIINKLNISQSSRWYRWSAKHPPILVKEIKESSANMHIIPADKEIRKTLKSVRKGQIVIIEGYLVRVDHPSGWKWVSSTSRKDTGGGACEIIYAKSLKIDKGA